MIFSSPKKNRSPYAWALFAACLALTGCSFPNPPRQTLTAVPPVVRTIQEPTATVPLPTPMPAPSQTPLPRPLNLEPAQEPPQIVLPDELSVNLARPGGVTVMWEPEPLLWSNGWCALDKLTLDGNASHLTFKFWTDEQEVPLNLFRREITRDENAGQDCLRYTAVLENWKPGLHRLRMDLTSDAPLNDGVKETPAGTQSQESLVYVSDPQIESALLERPDLWPVITVEDFDQPKLAWQNGEFKDDWFAGTSQVKDGKYLFSMDEVYKSTVYRHPPTVKVISGPFEVSVKTTRLDGEAADACSGLYFHYDYDTGDFYQFTICDTKTFTVEVFQHGTWNTIVPWSDAPSVQPGDANQLAVRVEGSHLTFLVNGNVVSEVQDEHLFRGYTGVFFKVRQGGVAKFALDDFQLRAP